MSTSYEYGVQYDSAPTSLRINEKTNPDGTVTKIIWQSQYMNEAAGKAWAKQCIESNAPIHAVRRKAVRRQVGPVEEVND